MMTKSTFYHEDFHTQIELVPQENYANNLASFAKILDNEDSNKGYWEIFVREEKGFSIAERQIKLADVQSLFSPLQHILIEEVYTGYSSYSVRCENTIVYGFERIGIFLEFNNDGIIHDIWLHQTGDLLDSQSGDNLANAIFLLSTQYKLILVDWNEELMVDTSVLGNIKNYLMGVFYFES